MLNLNHVKRSAILLATGLFFIPGTTVRAEAPVDPNVPANGQRTVKLVIDVENVRNSKGTIDMLVFRNPEGWPDEIPHAVNAQEVKAEQGKVVLEVPGLPPGDYAVLAMHDENGNRRIDKDWRGVPKEQWGMSNNPRALLTTPAFERAKFHVTGDTEIHIQLKLYP